MGTFLSKNNYLLRKPIIIIGTGRSGTTIISDILFQHEYLAWHSNYQEFFPKSSKVNYIRRVFDNNWWRKIGMNTQYYKSFFNRITFRPIEGYDFWEAVTGPRINFSRSFLLNEKATDQEKESIRTFFAKMVKYQKRKRLAFKITGPSRMEYLLSIFPDALFINIMREPVATVRSWLEVDFWQDKGISKLWWTGAYSPEEETEALSLSGNPALITAFQYRKLMQTTKQEIKKLGLKVYNANYEDFVREPREFIKGIMKYVDLPPSKHVDSFLNNISVKDRNQRKSASEKTILSEDTKKQIIDLVNS